VEGIVARIWSAAANSSPRHGFLRLGLRLDR
jgi:hypothetical protein